MAGVQAVSASDIPDTDIQRIERIQVAEINPGDTVIITLPEQATPDEMERFAEAFKDRFPNNEVLIVSSGVEIAVKRET